MQPLVPDHLPRSFPLLYFTIPKHIILLFPASSSHLNSTPHTQDGYQRTTQRGATANNHNIFLCAGTDAQCTTPIEHRDGCDESNSSFLWQINLYSFIISCNIQGLNKKKQKHNVQLKSELVNTENALTNTLTETHLNEKILDSEIQMKNYIGFRADRTLGRKIGGV